MSSSPIRPAPYRPLPAQNPVAPQQNAQLFVTQNPLASVVQNVFDSSVPPQTPSSLNVFIGNSGDYHCYVNKKGMIKICNGKDKYTFSSESPNLIRHITAFAASSTHLAFAQKSGHINIFDPSNEDMQVVNCEIKGSITIAWASSNKLVILPKGSTTLMVYDTDTRKLEPYDKQGLGSLTILREFADDYVLVGTSEGRGFIWNPITHDYFLLGFCSRAPFVDMRYNSSYKELVYAIRQPNSPCTTVTRFQVHPDVCIPIAIYNVEPNFHSIQWSGDTLYAVSPQDGSLQAFVLYVPKIQ